AELIASVWGGRSISEATLSSRVYAARKALGDSGQGQQLIRTVARRGLRFVGDVRTQASSAVLELAAARASSSELAEDTHQTWPLPKRPTIAVLPFDNMCSDPAQEYFADAISEDIIMRLSKLRWFSVTARNSSFTYKRKAVH